MKTGRLLLLCILAAALVSTVVCHSGPTPNECCFRFYSRRVKKDRVQSYYMTDKRCAKAGVILVTAKSAHICVNPADAWVNNIMKTLDDKFF